jgi:hypothetical protein
MSLEGRKRRRRDLPFFGCRERADGSLMKDEQYRRSALFVRFSSRQRISVERAGEPT